ncbi:hypothetical protein CCP3SC1AL1_4720002 [Gammaproteobacteria bacterium]
MVSGRVMKVENYKVTKEPARDTPFSKLPESVKEKFWTLAQSLKTNRMNVCPQGSIAYLKQMLKIYPEVPQIYNYLYNTYKISQDHINARLILEETVRRFPDYLFGRVALAHECIDKNEFDRVPKIFESKYDLKLLYPKRNSFHVTEVLFFCSLMARYFHAIGRVEKIQKYHKIMKKINSDPDLSSFPIIFKTYTLGSDN